MVKSGMFRGEAVGNLLEKYIKPEKLRSTNFHPATKTDARRRPFAFELGGVEGDRTPDLMNAIHALSQLSYDPGFRPEGQILNLPKLPRRVKGRITVP